MILCWRWEQMRIAVEGDPFGPAGFAAFDRMAGWLEGYADFCEEDGDPIMAADIRWLTMIAIQLCKLIRLEAMQADPDLALEDMRPGGSA